MCLPEGFADVAGDRDPIPTLLCGLAVAAKLDLLVLGLLPLARLLASATNMDLAPAEDLLLSLSTRSDLQVATKYNYAFGTFDCARVTPDMKHVAYRHTRVCMLQKLGARATVVTEKACRVPWARKAAPFQMCHAAEAGFTV